MRRVSSLLLVALLLSAALPTVQAVNWPVFQGDALHTGKAIGTVPSELDVFWTLELDGAIKASPIVADGLVFIGTEEGSAYAVGAKSGRPVWGPVSLDNPILGTMAFENNRLYVATSALDGSAGTLYVLHAKTGQELIKRDIASGSYAGPVVEDGKVFVGTDSGKMIAYETEGMTKLWEFDTALTIKSSLVPSNTNDDCCLRSNVAAKAVKVSPMSYDKHIYFTSFNHQLFAVDSGGNPGAETTNLVWAENLHDIGYSSGGIDLTRKVIVVGSYNGQVASFNLQPYSWTDSCQNQTKRTYHAVGNPCSSNINWYYSTGSRVFSSPAMANDRAYVGDNDGTVHAINLATGLAAWTHKVGGGVYASPAVAGKTVVVGAYDGKIYVFNEDDKGALVGAPSSYTLAGKLHSSPAIVDGVVYVASDLGMLYALAAPSAVPEPGPAAPDVAVEDVTMEPAVPIVNQPVTMNIRLRNVGDGDASEAALRVYNGSFLMSESLVRLSAGQAKTHPVTFTPDQVGDLTLRIVFDEPGALYELDTANNILSRTFTITDGSGQPAPTENEGDTKKKSSDEDAPAPGLVVVLAIFAGLAVALRRRRF